MDFNDTPEEAAFRLEVRGFLKANAALKGTAGPANFRGEIGAAELAAAKAWQATKAAAGYAGITLPKRWGGREAPAIMQVIYAQEEEKYSVPTGVFDIGLGMCLPSVIHYADPELSDRLVPSALRGEEIWCQLFSEPAGGSDLAALRTRAERAGDEWIINGQKIWTSGAHLSDWGLLVARTDPTVSKHAGLTVFIVDMKLPGIEIRPIHQMSGASHFNEVFFTNLKIPDAYRLGEVGKGWRVSLTTLMNERLTGGFIIRRPDISDLVDLCRLLTVGDRPAIKADGVRQRIAAWYVRSQGIKLTQFRTLTALSRGKEPGPENSIGKLVNASMAQEIADYGLDLMDAGGLAMDPELAPLNMLFQEAFLATPGSRIAGGTDEILRNIIAERVLEMPADIRVDKNIPFNQIPTG
ncbi:acyl-CoA dehydrogenase family protein [Tardiphaga sp. 538_B7_N1_4]|jgi:alkylation response protein AidB-like acyl-CoA dehydrogenase|uniref:acyl-CoA dehydrogenase family protein n=1 Tax=Tardiphaga sp. 538_B7_N1_4 TaxID=3240778 RepID=UPI001B8A01C7|nr:acyl-CoA dehydrogenase family protein [Bradyrhizobium diazoefficiens]MBR0967332.1 acyl-CoA dehydrogenase family protein [Bradyrhizobium diazoefficiens]MBR0976653.1 acyl-CoA dehydrogenase family protein [Bradyrhizobium diazoefficiens]MBR1005298.1 acyl-CoA dehydrogenase family protein [Bradyrhizobium diazoefficiens]MBR1011771.1 acyl-CoA dehydrogenase family protein [Bradyrhizobium diazoefficiens]MBR1049112.1 acyl-CoA dehydrogenase family protein [Bradyrhizobium diazoefficiens]